MPYENLKSFLAYPAMAKQSGLEYTYYEARELLERCRDDLRLWNKNHAEEWDYEGDTETLALLRVLDYVLGKEEK